MITKPFVSIIMCAYNASETIEESINSVLAQTYTNFELIIIDDCSTDDTFNVASSFLDKRIKIFKTEKNGGAAAARNLGIDNASGDFIAFLDSDDLWKKEKLAKQIDFMLVNSYDFSFTNYDLKYKNGKIKQYRINKTTINYKMLLKTNYIGCLTVLYNTKLIGKKYMPMDCEKREDHAAWLDILKTGIEAHHLDESLSVYRIGNSSISSNKIKMIKYQYYLYRNHEHFNVFKSLWYLFVCIIYKITKKY